MQRGPAPKRPRQLAISADALRSFVSWLPAEVEGTSRELLAHDFYKRAKSDRTMRSCVNVLGDLTALWSHLSTEHQVVAAYGRSTYNQPLAPLVWTSIQPGQAVPPVRAIGRAGGQPSCPALRLVPASSQAWKDFEEFLGESHSD